MNPVEMTVEHEGRAFTVYRPGPDARLPMLRNLVKTAVEHADDVVDPDRGQIAQWLTDTVKRTSIRKVTQLLRWLVDTNDLVRRRIYGRWYYGMPILKQGLLMADLPAQRASAQQVSIAAISSPPRSRKPRRDAGPDTPSSAAEMQVEIPVDLHAEMHVDLPIESAPTTQPSTKKDREQAFQTKVEPACDPIRSSVSSSDYITGGTNGKPELQHENGASRARRRAGAPAGRINLQSYSENEDVINPAGRPAQSPIQHCPVHQAPLLASTRPSAINAGGGFFYCPAIRDPEGNHCNYLFHEAAGQLWPATSSLALPPQRYADLLNHALDWNRRNHSDENARTD